MKISTAIRFSLSVVFATLFLSCQPPQQSEKQVVAAPEKDGVFVHISHGASEPRRLLMGLRMADVMSADKDVLVYFDIEGVEVVIKAAEEINQEPFESARTQLQALLSKGVSVYVCPSCLAAAGGVPDQVLEGVEIANKEAFFDFTKGRILTLDY